MAEKDVTEKTLEAYNDVFADIVNVLLFQGLPVIEEEELEDALPRSHYKADGLIHEQERDIAKYWKQGRSNIRISLLGIENQTSVDADMPLRVIGYDGAAYRSQLLKDTDKPEKNPRYPVVTMVLYFGEKRWNKPLNLLKCLDVPDVLAPYVNDYNVKLIEISYLTEEQVSLFQSDFRVVADYFVQRRRDKSYCPSAKILKHVHEVFELMAVLTGDSRYEKSQYELVEGRTSMRDFILDEIENKGMEKGLYQAIVNLMQTTKMPMHQAMDALMVPEKDRKKYEGMICQDK